jgi:hypothetical protein
MGFAANETPHLIDLRRLHTAHFYPDRFRTASLDNDLVDLREGCGLFFRFFSKVSG